MVLTAQQRGDYRQWLEAQGYDLTLIDRRAAPMMQWYKPNGEAIATKSKSDSYHMQLYRARAWTMSPPPQVPEGTQVHWDGMKWEIVGNGNGVNGTKESPMDSGLRRNDENGNGAVGTVASPTCNCSCHQRGQEAESEKVGKHVHQFGKRMGSACKYRSCDKVRMQEYRPRAKRSRT